MTNKTEKIREIIIKAVPEIVELKRGCKIVEGSMIYIHADYVGFINKYGEKHDGTILDSEIIGRDITLEDVLVAMENSIRGEAAIEEAQAITLKIISLWRMGKTLEDQDEPTIDFIYNLLKQNK